MNRYAVRSRLGQCGRALDIDTPMRRGLQIEIDRRELRPGEQLKIRCAEDEMFVFSPLLRSSHPGFSVTLDQDRGGVTLTARAIVEGPCRTEVLDDGMLEEIYSSVARPTRA